MNTEILSTSPILPVVVIDDPQQAIPLAKALKEGGIGSIEVTFRTQAAAEAIRLIREALPEMIVAAGTVLTTDQAQAALDAGAHFGLAPGLDETVIQVFQKAGKPFVPGVMTPTEVQAALKAGCRHLKFFPAEAAGGVAMLKSLAAPFKSQQVRFCPTGGLNLANLANMTDYLAIPEVFAIGGTWIAPAKLLAEQDFTTITTNCQAALNKL